MIETIFYFWKIFVKIILIVVLISSLKSVFFKKQYNLNNLRYNTFAMVISVIQLLISLIYYFTTYEINYNLFKSILSIKYTSLIHFKYFFVHFFLFLCLFRGASHIIWINAIKFVK